MREALLQYIWQNVDFEKEQFTADTGDKVTVLHKGELNTNQGPDFINAKVEINGTVWAGNIEIHTQSSHWFAHKHQTNPDYNNVVLHVVTNHDQQVKNSKGRTIPTIKLNYPKAIETRYAKLMQYHGFIPCADELPQLDTFRVKFWIESMIVERLESKSQQIDSYLQNTKNDWNEAFYISLCRNFGTNVNSEPFERLARSLPLKVINKHHKNVTQLEALLYGQAGLLPAVPLDGYSQNLAKEYAFLQKKYRLKNIDGNTWNFHRLRPVNFPTIRISQLANLIAQSSHLFSKVQEAENIKTLRNLFETNVSPYWAVHYQFDKQSHAKEKNTGKQLIDVICINTVIPFLFLFGKRQGIEKLCNRAFIFLENLPSENNRVIKQWGEIGIKSLNSGYSQALLQLKKEYCDKKQCIACQIGHLILSKGLH